MKEAWLIIYTDPQSYSVSVELVYEEPSSTYLYDIEYEVKHIVYAEIE
jgi:hypothetical protein